MDELFVTSSDIDKEEPEEYDQDFIDDEEVPSDVNPSEDPLGHLTDSQFKKLQQQMLGPQKYRTEADVLDEFAKKQDELEKEGKLDDDSDSEDIISPFKLKAKKVNKKKEKICSETQIQNPLSGLCVSVESKTIKELYRLRKAHNIIARYKEATKKGTEPSKRVLNSIDGAYKIFNDFKSKNPDDYAQKLKDIKNFFTKNPAAKEVYNVLNKCDNDDFIKQIDKRGAVSCKPKEVLLKKKKVKLSDCSDYVYSDTHKRCIKTDGKPFRQLSPGEGGEQELALTRNCKYVPRIVKTKDGKSVTKCGPKDADVLEAQKKEWDPDYKKKRNTKKQPIKKNDIQKVTQFMEDMDPSQLETMNKRELGEFIANGMTELNLDQLTTKHVNIIRRYLLAKAAYLKLTDKKINESIKSVLNEESKHINNNNEVQEILKSLSKEVSKDIDNY